MFMSENTPLVRTENDSVVLIYLKHMWWVELRQDCVIRLGNWGFLVGELEGKEAYRWTDRDRGRAGRDLSSRESWELR